MAKYNLTVDEVELRASPFEQQTQKHADDVGERLPSVGAAIAKLTGATVWQSLRGVHPIEITFFGFQHEVEIASYLLEICARAMRQERHRLATGEGRFLKPGARRRLILPFLDGMADRLSSRILAMIIPTPPGTGLVVLRGDLIRAAMKAEGVKLKSQNARRSNSSEASYADGQRAADKVSLNPGLAASGPSQGLLR